MYKSPIILSVTEPICNLLQDEQEKYVLQTLQSIGIDVDKKELIKALAYDRCQYEKGFYDGTNGIEKPNWISVNDRMPEPETEVIVAFDDGEVDYLWQNWGRWAEDEGDGPLVYFKSVDSKDIHKVTHWMKKPKPPINVEEET